MRLTASEEYGLRCLLQLARRGPAGSMTIAEIGKAEGLTTHYVGKMMRLLRQGGFVKSVRGHAGGYALTRSPSEIPLNDLFSHLGGKIFESDYCDRHSGLTELCIHSSSCSIRGLFRSLQEMVDLFLKKISLQDLLRGEPELRSWMARDSEPQKVAL